MDDAASRAFGSIDLARRFGYQREVADRLAAALV